MKEKQPIFRSASLNDLKNENNVKKSYLNFRDDMKTNSYVQRDNTYISNFNNINNNSNASNILRHELLNDLDNLLRNKLNLTNDNKSTISPPTSCLSFSSSNNKSSPVLNQHFNPIRYINSGKSIASNSDPSSPTNSTFPNNFVLDNNNSIDTNNVGENSNGNEDSEENDNNAVTEQEDEEFANVDEIDGFITSVNQLSPKIDLRTQNDTNINNTINKNHNNKSDSNGNNDNCLPPTNDTDVIDYNMPVGEEFQKILDKRVSEICENNRTHKNIPGQRIDWVLKDFYDLKRELSEWFTKIDYVYLDQLKSTFNQKIKNPETFVQDFQYKKSIIDRIFHNFDLMIDSNIQIIAYIALGTYEYTENLNINLDMIKENNLILIDYLPIIIDHFKEKALSCQHDTKNLKKKTVLLFYLSTVLFYIVTVCIDQRDESKGCVQKAISFIHAKKLMPFLTKYVEHWRWNSRLSMRIRNIISLLFKTIILQFGNENVYTDTKKKIYRYHGLEFKSTSNNNTNNDASSLKQSKKLSISPLHYRAFREDITSRFPNYELPKSELSETTVDDSNSLSQFLEIPRSKSRSVLNSSLAVPEKHLATPFPSPPSSPTFSQFNDNGIKPRKSFQANMAYPQLYPINNGIDDNYLSRIISPLENLDNNDKSVPDFDYKKDVPFSIEEAAHILNDNLKIKLSTKQLWHERNLFMSTERGWQKDKEAANINDSMTNSISDHKDDPFNYQSFNKGNEPNELQIMNRIDTYYMDCLASFNSLIFVLLQTIESNISNSEYRYKNDPSNYNTSHIQPQLEIIRSKEMLMRSCSGILVLLLKWFKLNHILKFEHFASLIYDFKYITVFSSLLGSYTDIYHDKIFNRLIEPDHSIWEICSQSNPLYSTSLQANPVEKDKYNIAILSSFTNLFKILRYITRDKTHRLKSLPLSIGFLFKKYYKVFCLETYHPMLKIVKELTPFKNKRWKSEHMDLISGVYLYERLELIDNWVTGKDIAGELNDAGGQEIALRALLQFYNFNHYKQSMEDLGYIEMSESNANFSSNTQDPYSSM
ncbi:Far11p PWA37_004618 [Arxiozyma heterogenica]|uniref:Factor arrest protein 11 n=1 Tax=Arxiozyma heterogenica TaxID=278026 RepID=A0AAN7WMM5_9SACH|nr:hypothetical protein RI543_000905 [Kazachstania heterogenica]